MELTSQWITISYSHRTHNIDIDMKMTNMLYLYRPQGGNTVPGPNRAAQLIGGKKKKNPIWLSVIKSLKAAVYFDTF